MKFNKFRVLQMNIKYMYYVISPLGRINREWVLGTDTEGEDVV